MTPDHRIGANVQVRYTLTNGVQAAPFVHPARASRLIAALNACPNVTTVEARTGLPAARWQLLTVSG